MLGTMIATEWNYKHEYKVINEYLMKKKIYRYLAPIQEW